MGFFPRLATALMGAMLLMGGVGLPCAEAGGRIQGSLALAFEDGQSAHGDWIRVLLITGKVAVPEADLPADLPPMARRDRISRLHLDFFVNARKRLPETGFLVASTLTTEDGTFLFPDVPAGDYYVLVTFPAMIADTKVAWQVPVAVSDGRTATVTLDRTNMALPTIRR